jgi:hypothetical protein
LRRADTVEVIGAALLAAGAGWGHRHIAELVERAASTVRGWLRRFAARAGPLREGFTTLAVTLQPAPIMPDPTGTPVGDAVAAILTAARTVRSRWPELALSVSAWQMAAAITSGRLLAPTLGTESINTSRLW